MHVLCAKYWNYFKTERDIMDQRDFVRFKFEMSFRRTSSYITQPTGASFIIIVVVVIIMIIIII